MVSNSAPKTTTTCPTRYAIALSSAIRVSSSCINRQPKHNWRYVVELLPKTTEEHSKTKSHAHDSKNEHMISTILNLWKARKWPPEEVRRAARSAGGFAQNVCCVHRAAARPKFLSKTFQITWAVVGIFVYRKCIKNKNEQSSWGFLRKVSFWSFLKCVEVDVNFIIGLWHPADDHRTTTWFYTKIRNAFRKKHSNLWNA